MNCIIVDDDELSRNMIEDLVEEINYINLVESCSNAIEASNVLQKGNIDLIFLDIEMPKMSGIDFVKSLTKSPLVILITSHEEYALESYELNIVDYLLKPVNPGRFLKAAGKAKDLHDAMQPSSPGFKKNIFVKAKSCLVKVNLEDILYVEALGNYVNIHTTKEDITVLSTMKEIENKLISDQFVRVHRSFIVRIDKVEAIDDNILVIGDKTISIGGSYKDELTKRLNLL